MAQFVIGPLKINITFHCAYSSVSNPSTITVVGKKTCQKEKKRCKKFYFWLWFTVPSEGYKIDSKLIEGIDIFGTSHHVLHTKKAKFAPEEKKKEAKTWPKMGKYPRHVTKLYLHFKLFSLFFFVFIKSQYFYYFFWNYTWAYTWYKKNCWFW